MRLAESPPGYPAATCADPGTDIVALTRAYPEFAIDQAGPGRNGTPWTAIRKNPAHPGLYAAVTTDLREPADALADQHRGHWPANPEAVKGHDDDSDDRRR